MRLKVTQDILDSISEVRKFITLLKENNKSLSTKSPYDTLNFLSLRIRRKAEQYVENKDFEEAAALYYLLSKVNLLLSSIIEDKQKSELLSSKATSDLRLVDSVLYSAINHYMLKGTKSYNTNEYQKSTEYKNKAKDLEFNIKNGIIYNKLDQEVEDLLKPLASQKQIKFETSPEETITPEQISVTNIYTPSTRKGKDWYDWTVYLVVENSDVIRQIKSVIYSLHPTFYQPVREVEEPTGGFKLDSGSWGGFKFQASGWGEFEIKADIILKESREVITKYHWLNLGLGPKR
jgi:hypothetical protein